MTMAYTKQTWNNDDPETPLSGSRLGHIEDGIASADSTATSAKATAEAAAPGDHKHDAADVTSGTFAAARIPAVAQSKVTGLSDALDAKADDADVTAKADQSALDALEARVAALETPAG